MKPTLSYDDGILDNADRFQDPFFHRFTLRPMPEPLRLDERVSKRYQFPTFYGDVTCAIAIFPCSYAKAERLMLHPRMKPVPMTRGRALVAFSCYVYRNVMGVPPYNEIAMTIPVLVDPKVRVPLLPLVMNGFPGFGYYVFSMPVTSLENRIRGREIWGLPKHTEEIDIRDEGGDCVTTAFDGDGRRYFDLRVPRAGAPTDFDVSSYLYSKLGNRLLKSRTCFKGTFQVQKHMGLLWKTGVQPDRPYLTLGEGPSADALRELEIEPHPFQTRYAERMVSCFDLADPTYRAPFDLT